MDETAPTLDEIFALTEDHDVRLDLHHDHRLFETLYDFTLLSTAIAIATGAVMHQGLIETSGRSMGLITNHFKKNVSIFMNEIFQLAVQEKKPDRISMAISKIYPPPYPVTMSSHGFDGVLHRPLMLPIAAFYDRHLPFIKEITTDSYQWPEPFNFFRIVRNSIAHQGQIDFRTSSAQPVTWRGISFSYGDNGKPLISEKFYVADAILLLLDASLSLDELGAPQPSSKF